MTMTLVASGVTGTFCLFGTEGKRGQERVGKGGEEGVEEGKCRIGLQLEVIETSRIWHPVTL